MPLDLKIKIKAYSAVQEAFIFDKSRYSVLSGGIGSGKTHAGVLKALKKCHENPKANGLVTAPDYNRITSSTMPKYLELFPPEFIAPNGINRATMQIRTILDNNIFFRSTTDPQTLRAYEVGWVHMDELTYSPYEAYIVCQGRMRQIEDAQLWGTSTPNRENPLNWVYAEFGGKRLPEHSPLYVLDTRGNPHLPQAYKDDLKRQYGDELAMIELAGQFVPISGNAFFDTEMVRRMLEEDGREPLEDRGDVKIWKPHGIGKRYMAGADVAEGRQAGDVLGGTGNPDFSCLMILDANTNEQVAEIHGRIPPEEFALEVYNLGKEYDWPFLGVETFIDSFCIRKVLELGYPVGRIYHWKEEEGGDKDYQPGWKTTSGSRPAMLSDYAEGIRERSIVLHSRESLMEHLSFIRNRLGRPEAAHNAHDDYVMALAIAWAMRHLAPRRSFHKVGKLEQVV